MDTRVSSASRIGRRPTALVILTIMLGGCNFSSSLDGPFPLDPSVGPHLIGPAGGSIKLLLGPTLTIPPGALSTDVVVTLNATCLEVNDYDAVSWCYTATPRGLRLDVPATISFPTTSHDAGRVTAYWSPDGDPRTYQDIGGTQEVDRFTASLDVLGTVFIGRTCATRRVSCQGGGPVCSGPASLAVPTGGCSAGRCLWTSIACPGGCVAGACQ
jgi:hypothetical protein